MKKLLYYFTKFEICLWCASALMIVGSFAIFDRFNYLTLIASLIGITSLIFCAKGNPIGQVLMVLFSLIYGWISFRFTYYGEMLTYIGMTLPMSVYALISWLRNPYRGNRAEVAVNVLGTKECLLMWLLAIPVTVAFYFILRQLGTANLLPGTLSVTTSFIAVYLTARRSPFFALAYAANDLVLIVLWTLASITDLRYLSVVFCFVAFLFNDLYTFFNWQKMKKRQAGG